MREGAVEFYGEDELRERLEQRLREGRPLRVKLGMDPSAPDLHLGHTVVLRKLRRFQELGHTPIFLVGDFTGADRRSVGAQEDAAGAGRAARWSATPPATSSRRVACSTWRAPRSASTASGCSGCRPTEMVQLCSRYTVARLLERDDFAKRYKAGDPISVHEFLYPFVQAYDSVALEADVELGGTDQTFNLLMAREIQRDYGQPAQAVITHPLLVGLDGRDKMSKSLGNAIGITRAARVDVRQADEHLRPADARLLRRARRRGSGATCARSARSSRAAAAIRSRSSTRSRAASSRASTARRPPRRRRSTSGASVQEREAPTRPAGDGARAGRAAERWDCSRSSSASGSRRRAGRRGGWSGRARSASTASCVADPDAAAVGRRLPDPGRETPFRAGSDCADGSAARREAVAPRGRARGAARGP